MNDAERRERVAARYRAAIRETEAFEDATRGHDCGEAVDRYIHLLENSCSDVPILLQREAALLKVAEAALIYKNIMLQAYTYPDAQMVPETSIVLIQESRKVLWSTLEAWQKGRTP